MAEPILQAVVRTKNISEALSDFAAENFLPSAECDFTIDRVETFIKNDINSDVVCTDSLR